MKSEGAASVGKLGAHIGQAAVRIGFRAESPKPDRLELSYELQSDRNVGLTYIVVSVEPGAAFQGRQVKVQSRGRETSVRCPFGRQGHGLGSDVDAVRLTDAQGQTTVLRFDPPCDIDAEGTARVIVAKDKLSVGEVRRLKITVELPSETDWYPTSADVPNEPGLAAWYPWHATGDTGPSAIGMRDWIEAPAGKHGRITREGEKLIYNGQPIKLWGLNLCYGQCTPDKELARKHAAFYTKYGINAVRLHKWVESGIQSKGSCVQFDPQLLDQMDYQVAEFKKAGIYVTLSANFGTLSLGPADKQYVPYMDEFGPLQGGWLRMPHSAAHYSPELQRVQALQVTNLLRHKNPYTGMTYAEDPVVAAIEIVNEQSILFYTTTEPLRTSATIRKQVGQRFCQWLRAKYGSQEKLEAAWGKGAFDSFTYDGFPKVGENLDKGNILPIGNPWYWDPGQIHGGQAWRSRRLLDSLQFLYTLQCEFFDGYTKAVREAGYQGELIGSNWQAGRGYSHFANLHSDYRVGLIDRHNYAGDKTNASMLDRAGSGMLSTGMQQVVDRPFMISEWIHCFPLELGVEGPTVLGAYGYGLQGWDGSFMFQNGDPGTFNGKLGDTWAVNTPQLLGVFPAVSRQVHRGDVRESETVAVRNVHVPSLFDGKLSFDDKVVQGYDQKELDSSKVPARALAAVRNVVAFTKDYTDTPVFDLRPYEKDGQIVSATGQLRWKEKAGKSGGYFTMDTPGTKAVVGFAAGRKCQLGNVTIEPLCPYGAIYVTAREPGQTVDSAGELLIVAIARARNTGEKFSPAGDRMLVAGGPPIIMEPVKAKITVRRSGAAKVIVLDHDGRITKKEVPLDGGSVTIDGARDKTPYYLLRY